MFRPPHHADGVALASGKMQGDVAPIVDVGAIESRCFGHGGKNGFGDGPSDGSHWSDETAVAIRRDRVGHVLGNWAGWQGRNGSGTTAQKRQFCAEFIEDGDESLRCRFIGAPNFIWRRVCINDQVDGAIVQVKSMPIGQKSDCGGISHSFASLSERGFSGQGFSGRETSWRCRCFSRMTSSSGRMKSMWPPSEA